MFWCGRDLCLRKSLPMAALFCKDLLALSRLLDEYWSSRLAVAARRDGSCWVILLVGLARWKMSCCGVVFLSDFSKDCVDTGLLAYYLLVCLARPFSLVPLCSAALICRSILAGAALLYWPLFGRRLSIARAVTLLVAALNIGEV